MLNGVCLDVIQSVPLLVVRTEQTFRSEGVSPRSHIVACCQVRLRDDCDRRRSPLHLRKQTVAAGLTGEEEIEEVRRSFSCPNTDCS